MSRRTRKGGDPPRELDFSFFDVEETVEKTRAILALLKEKNVKRYQKNELPEFTQLELKKLEKLWGDLLKLARQDPILARKFFEMFQEEQGSLVSEFIPIQFKGSHLMLNEPENIKMNERMAESIEIEIKKEKEILSSFEKSVDSFSSKAVLWFEEEKKKFREKLTKNREVLEKMLSGWKSLQTKKTNDDFVVSEITNFTPLLTDCFDVFEIVLSYVSISELLQSIAITCVFFNNIVMKKLKVSLDFPLRLFLNFKPETTNLSNFRIETLSVSMLETKHTYFETRNKDFNEVSISRRRNLTRVKSIVVPNVYILRKLDLRSLDFYVPMKEKIIRNRNYGGYGGGGFDYGGYGNQGNINRPNIEKLDGVGIWGIDKDNMYKKEKEEKVALPQNFEITNLNDEPGDVNNGTPTDNADNDDFNYNFGGGHGDGYGGGNNNNNMWDGGGLGAGYGGGGGYANPEESDREVLMKICWKIVKIGRDEFIKLICQCPCLETLGFKLFTIPQDVVDVLPKNCPNLVNFLVDWPESLGGKELTKFQSFDFDGDPGTIRDCSPLESFIHLLQVFQKRIRRLEIGGLFDDGDLPLEMMLKMYNLVFSSPKITHLKVPYFIKSIGFRDEWIENLCRTLKSMNILLIDSLFAELHDKFEKIKDNNEKIKLLGKFQDQLSGKFIKFLEAVQKNPKLQKMRFAFKERGWVPFKIFTSILQFPKAILRMENISLSIRDEKYIEEPLDQEGSARVATRGLAESITNISKIILNYGLQRCRITNTLLTSTRPHSLESVVFKCGQLDFFKKFSAALPVFVFSKNYSNIVFSVSRISHDSMANCQKEEQEFVSRVKFEEPYLIITKMFLSLLEQLIQPNKENLKKIIIRENTDRIYHFDQLYDLQDSFRPDQNEEQVPDDKDFERFFEVLSRNTFLEELIVDYPFRKDGIDNNLFNKKVKEILQKREKVQK